MFLGFLPQLVTLIPEGVVRNGAPGCAPPTFPVHFQGFILLPGSVTAPSYMVFPIPESQRFVGSS